MGLKANMDKCNMAQIQRGIIMITLTCGVRENGFIKVNMTVEMVSSYRYIGIISSDTVKSGMSRRKKPWLDVIDHL